MSQMANEGQPQWTPPTKEEFEQVVGAFWQSQARNEAMASYINAMGEQQAQAQPQPSAVDEDDELEDLLFDTDKMRGLIAEGVHQTLNQHPMVRQAAEQRGAQIAQEVFNRIEQEIGTFDRAMAYHIAQSFSYANPQADPVQALYAGSQQARQFAEQARTQAIEEYRQQLANLATPQAGAEAGGPAASPMRHTEVDYDKVAENFFARRTNPQLSPN